MAEVQIPVGYVQLTWSLVHTGIQHTALVTLGAKVEAAPFTSANAASCLAEYRTAFLAVHDSEITYARCVGLVGNDGPLLRVEAAGSTAGTRGATVVQPPNVCYVLRKTTAFSGRQYRGRMYVPYVSPLDVDQAGKLTGAAVTLLNTAGNGLIAALVSVAGCNISEVSLLHAAPQSGSPPLPTPIVTMGATPFVGTQRRRLTRV